MTTLDIAMAGYLAFGQLIPGGQQEIVKHAGLQVIHADGAVTLRLKETARQESDGLIAITLKDEYYPFEVKRFVKTWPDCDAVETWLEIKHDESGPVRLLRADSFASMVKCAEKPVRVMSLSGSWAREANICESEVAPGQAVHINSLSGTRDAWEANAAMMVSFGENVDEDAGKVLGIALEWTGTTEQRVHRNWDGSATEVFSGADMTTGPYVLDPGVVFTTPKAILAWSENGRGAVSRSFHRWSKNHLIPHGRTLHPVLLNSWEGAYFSFTEQTLLDMMDGVAELGGEMFVLDDGWFGEGKFARDEKNTDTAGLGDWRVNRAKLPHGLEFLSAEAKKRGLAFGVWVEPEMVNTRSHLAEAHPEWLLREDSRPLALGRGGTQTVLDLTNPAVRDNIYSQLDAVYSQVPDLAYIKWDCNQNIVNPGSTYLPRDRQSNLWYDYTKCLYELLARLQSKRPHIMVQACASGGGHMDFGFLRYADEFWTSDCTDPFRRIFIQWGASQFYPASAMACHVTASPNHQTKRVTPLKYRFDVAMCGRLGIELHPMDLSQDEIEFAKSAITNYKRIRPTVQNGDLYRLVSPYKNQFASLMYVGEGGSKAVLFALGLDKKEAVNTRIRLKGLDPSAVYRIVEINTLSRAPSSICDDAITGRELMEEGIEVSLEGPYDSAVFEFDRL